jgi:hypothetical protein
MVAEESIGTISHDEFWKQQRGGTSEKLIKELILNY